MATVKGDNNSPKKKYRIPKPILPHNLYLLNLNPHTLLESS